MLFHDQTDTTTSYCPAIAAFLHWSSIRLSFVRCRFRYHIMDTIAATYYSRIASAYHDVDEYVKATYAVPASPVMYCSEQEQGGMFSR